MIEAIALHNWPSSFLRRAGSIVQLHNTNIKYNLNNTHVPKAKRKISGSLLPIYPWEGYYANNSRPIYLIGVIRRQVICLPALYGSIGRLDLFNKLLYASPRIGLFDPQHSLEPPVKGAAVKPM